jgi:uncharacterized protein (UPF0332 family)
VSPLWQNAMDAADEARLLFEKDHFRGAVSRTYYAVFTAARVLLVEREGYPESDIRRHSAVLRLFSDRIVKTGLFDRELGRRLHVLSEERASADYQPVPVTENDARQALEFMERFLNRASELREQESKR